MNSFKMAAADGMRTSPVLKGYGQAVRLLKRRAELYDALDGWITVNYVISQLELPDVGVQFGVEEKV
jgi:hypothetical protein